MLLIYILENYAACQNNVAPQYSSIVYIFLCSYITRVLLI